MELFIPKGTGEDVCGGATFGIDNLQFIPALYKITYNLVLNYKLYVTVKTEIWKIWPEVCKLLSINRLRMLITLLKINDKILGILGNYM
jgi:hypothetical protein